MTRTALFAALLLLLVGPSPAGAQCAMCRRVLESPEGQHLVAAFRSGIAILLPAPFVTFGAIALAAIRRFGVGTSVAAHTTSSGRTQ